MTPITSRTIDNLRLPLILGVVMIHSCPFMIIPDPIPTMWAAHLLSEVFTRCCVPLFFAISSFLLFRGARTYSKDLYSSKVRSRVSTILIPYLVWNGVAFVLFSAKTFITEDCSFSLICNRLFQAFIGRDSAHNFLEPYSSPYDFPLWFIRDLFVYVLLSPIFFYLIKKCGKLIIIFLSLCFITGFWPQMLFFSISGVLFFSIGAYFAINNIDPGTLIDAHIPLSRIIVIAYPLLIIADTLSFFYAPKIYLNLHACQIYVGFFAIYIICHYLSKTNEAYKSRISGKAVFAIYVMHALIAVYISKIKAYFNMNEVLNFLVVYFFDFFGMVIISLMIFYIINKISPRLSSVLFGGKYAPLAFKKR